MPDLDHSSILQLLLSHRRAWRRAYRGVPPAVVAASSPPHPPPVRLSPPTACDFRCKNLTPNPSLLLTVVEQWLRTPAEDRSPIPLPEHRWRPSPPNPA